MQTPDKRPLKIYRCILCIVLFILAFNSIALTIRLRKVSKRQRYLLENMEENRPWISPTDPFDNVVKAGTKGKICICMFYTKNIKEYSDIAYRINKKYAIKHGYDLIKFEKQFSERQPAWDKIKAVLDCLNRKNEKNEKTYNYVFWIDSDAIFNLQEYTIESIISKKYDFFICDDHYDSVANTGTFCIKNTEWSKKFLEFWWDSGTNSIYSHKFPWEQKIFSVIYKNDAFGIQNKCVIKKRGTFNSNPNVNKFPYGWDKTYIVHLMALKREQRKAILSEFEQKINGNV